MTSHGMTSGVQSYATTTSTANKFMRSQVLYSQPLTSQYMNLRQQLQNNTFVNSLMNDYNDNNQSLSTENPMVKTEPLSTAQMHGYDGLADQSRSPSVDDDTDTVGMNSKNNPTLMEAHMQQTARGERATVVSMSGWSFCFGW